MNPATFDNALTVPLGHPTPKAGAIEGTPMEASVTLFEDDRTEAGVWECTPGSWTSSKDGIGELMHFVAGSGVITDSDGTRHEFRPGSVQYYPDGWSGTWTVIETVRKIYVITRA